MQDKVMPTGKWEFDSEVTAVFDDMLARSIPQYEVMRQAVFDIGKKFVRRDKFVVDLGASRGGAVAPFVDHFGGNSFYYLNEVSEPMVQALNSRFSTLVSSDIVKIGSEDLRHDYPPFPACLTLCVLTLQFTPIEYRQRILHDIYEHTMSGGALIVVEKVLGATAPIDGMMVETYYNLKKEHGYTQEQIASKRKSLEGVLVPVTAAWNEELLKQAGFTQVDCFWRWMNFAAWVAIK